LAAQEPAILGYIPGIPQAASEYFGVTPDPTRNFATVTQKDSVVLNVNGTKIEILNNGNLNITANSNLTISGNSITITGNTVTITDSSKSFTPTSIDAGIELAKTLPLPS